MDETDVGYVDFVKEVWVSHLRLATLLCGDQHQAEELLQASLVELYVRWDRVIKRGDAHAYLRRMLVNGNVSRWRRMRRELLTASTPDIASPTFVTPEPCQQLKAALLALPRHQRAVVVLRHYADLSEREVAAALGCSVGTVKSQHSRAIARLRAQLSPLDSLTEEALR